MVAASKAHSIADNWRITFVHAGLAALFIIVAAAWAGPHVAYAEAPRQKLTISPVANDIALNPGESYTGSMTVVNQGQGTMQLQLYPSPYFVSGEQYSPVFSDVDQSVRADSWVHMAPKTATAVSQAVVTVDYTVVIPASAKPGGYYAVLFAQAAAGASGSIGLSERAGEILYTTVKGPVTQSGKVVFTPVAGLSFSPTLSPTLRVRNTGSVHFTAEATWTLTPIFGGRVDTIHQTAHVLPGTMRLIAAPLTLRPHFGIGVYTLSRTVTYVGMPEHTSQLVVYISPAWPAIIASGLGVGILIRLSYGKRARGKHV